MNGRILYVIEPSILNVGKHNIEFYIFKDNSPLKCESYFEIINEYDSQIENKTIEKDLNLLIQIISEAELMCDIRKDEVKKVIEVFICFDSQQFLDFITIKKWSNEKIEEFKTNIMKNIALYVLLLGNQYEKNESIDEKNNLIMSYIKSFSFNN
ncbi:hypothetical protein [Spiroplasma sp. SV19]|uniref:hypothetical protein n=1 Tax=Spiroplasma sp. SV19 TaxID=2570468 RepID=UPI0024B652D8|nr:hypothetical protein [Spiroplasma sp. SV19]WHQ37501.1 hypothetical protein E7Y35_06625 [Spiroplasma sp. SV19]